MKWSEVEYSEVQKYKINQLIFLPWDKPENTEQILKYEKDGEIVAFIRISVDPLDNKSIYIDEFEVVKPFRKQGLGKRSISDLILDSEVDIKLMVKNASVQKFWEKCGFVDDGITIWEIPLTYKSRKVKQEVLSRVYTVEKEILIENIKRLLLETPYFVCNQCYLRGSYVDETSNDLSDIDLLIVSQDFCGIIFQKRRELVRKALEDTEYKLKVDVICLSEEEYFKLLMDKREMYYMERLIKIL